MILVRFSIVTLLVFLLHNEDRLNAQPLRIMPLGNSITHDDNVADKTNPRPVGDRISYRYRLFQLIKAAGYEFDFVGSENAGNNYFQNEEYDDNAGFGGINDGQMAYLINTGYNQRAAQYEAPGPYLLYYPADVILLHIGTNDIGPGADEVEDILDNIRLYDNDVTIMVARIISRQPYPHALTTTFNNNVEAMVNARGDNRIHMVNMETGAGINYISDMADYLHPNTTGYNKMAAKWFEALDNLNTPPQISTIPEQITIQGQPFSPLILDNYISDNEDTDSQIEWSYGIDEESKIDVIITSNRILNLSANDVNWFGSDTLILKAKDSGNGSFRKSDSVSVVVTVIKGNEPPVIISEPLTTIDENQVYSYTIQAEDEDPLTFSAPLKPAWLTFSASTHTLTGKPSNNEVGTHSVSLSVTDGDETVYQNFEIIVKNVNDLPVVTSTPVITANPGQTYTYEFTAIDPDCDDTIHFFYVSGPAWLSFSNSNNKGLLFGIPDESNVGANRVILSVTDGKANILQGFTIQVSPLTPIESPPGDESFVLFPNPVAKLLYIKVPQKTDIRFILYDLTGRIQRDYNLYGTDRFEFDVSRLPNGMYLFKAFLNDRVIEGKLLKTE